jgi:glycosyltransferase involved in cell wall biosynthesis
MSRPGSVEVVVSTYNHPRALNLALHALLRQSRSDFRVCIADDGSGPATEALLAAWRPRLGERLRHIWQDDQGFRKNRILNRAIASSGADYLIFLDGDCLPSEHFVARHLALARPQRFCTGGVIRLSLASSERIEPADVDAGTVFTSAWLQTQGALHSTSARLKAGAYPLWASRLAERLTLVKRTWNGGNSSTARINLIRVNGFDENFGYGAEDIELGFRLNNAGIHGCHLRYTAPVLHLEHERAYAQPGDRSRNKRAARQILRQGKTMASQGIGEL